MSMKIRKLGQTSEVFNSDFTRKGIDKLSNFAFEDTFGDFRSLNLTVVKLTLGTRIPGERYFVV
jgi:hypothetical protein